MSDLPEIHRTLWKDRRVLVTGATGFVGSWLVEDLLNLGASVVALVRDYDPQSRLIRGGSINKISVVNGSLEDYRTLERAISENEVDTVFHLAAQPLVGVANRSPLMTFETNIRGTYHLLEACRVHSGLVKRIVVASSDKAYGEGPNLPYDETMPLRGQYPYEVSKSCADLLAQSYSISYGLPVGIARCGNIYGGGDLNFSRIVPSTIKALQNGDQPIIRSDGTFVRDYVYVKDVSIFYILLANYVGESRAKDLSFNFSAERPLSVLEIVQEIRKLMNCEHLTPIIENSARGEIHSQYLSSEKARKVLQWTPAYDLVSGLKETIAWYQSFLGDKSQ